MAEHVAGVAGLKGRPDSDRTALRHGTGSVVLGGRKVAVRRPRVRPPDGTGAVAVPVYELLSSIDVLGQLTMRLRGRGPE